MTFFSRIRNWFAVPPGVTLAFDRDGEISATHIKRQGKLVPNFTHGVEIENDEATHADFVVEMLIAHFGMRERRAKDAMHLIHYSRCAVIRTDSHEEAERIATGITEEARARGYPLVCRAVSAESGLQATDPEANS